MKTLLIDDLRDIKATVVVRTFEEGIDALKIQGPFDILYLDHDLGQETLYQNEYSNDRTGYTIMCFLEEYSQYLPKDIIFVTSNPVGRKRMQVVKDRIYRK